MDFHTCNSTEMIQMMNLYLAILVLLVRVVWLTISENKWVLLLCYLLKGSDLLIS